MDQSEHSSISTPLDILPCPSGADPEKFVGDDVLMLVVDQVAPRLSLADLLTMTRVRKCIQYIVEDQIRRYPSLSLRVGHGISQPDESWPWFLQTVKQAHIYHDFIRDQTLDLTKLRLPETVTSVVIRYVDIESSSDDVQWRTLNDDPMHRAEILGSFAALSCTIILSETTQRVKLPEISPAHVAARNPRDRFFIRQQPGIFSERCKALQRPWQYQDMVPIMKFLDFFDASGNNWVLDSTICFMDDNNVRCRDELCDLLSCMIPGNFLESNVPVKSFGTEEEALALIGVHGDEILGFSERCSRLSCLVNLTEEILSAWSRHYVTAIKCRSLRYDVVALNKFDHLRTLHLTKISIETVSKMQLPSQLEILTVSQDLEFRSAEDIPHTLTRMDKLPASLKFFNITTKLVLFISPDELEAHNMLCININYTGSFLDLQDYLEFFHEDYTQASLMMFCRNITSSLNCPLASLSPYLERYRGPYDVKYNDGMDVGGTKPQAAQVDSFLLNESADLEKCFQKSTDALTMAELILTPGMNSNTPFVDSFNLLKYSSYRELLSLIMTDCLVNHLPPNLTYLRFLRTPACLDHSLAASKNSFKISLPASLRLLVVTFVEDLYFFRKPTTTEPLKVMVTSSSPRSREGLTHFDDWTFCMEHDFDLFHKHEHPFTWHSEYLKDIDQ